MLFTVYQNGEIYTTKQANFPGNEKWPIWRHDDVINAENLTPPGKKKIFAPSIPISQSIKHLLFKRIMHPLTDSTICKAVKHSWNQQLKSNWYVQKLATATGGSLCVELANISVYYIMRQHVYNNKKLMKSVKHIKRYIDDGACFSVGLYNQFIGSK